MSRFVDVEVEEVVRETDAAVLLSIEGSEIWVPKSQIKADSPAAVGMKNVVITMTRWIADKHDLEYVDAS